MVNESGERIENPQVESLSNKEIIYENIWDEKKNGLEGSFIEYISDNTEFSQLSEKQINNFTKFVENAFEDLDEDKKGDLYVLMIVLLSRLSQEEFFNLLEEDWSPELWTKINENKNILIWYENDNNFARYLEDKHFGDYKWFLEELKDMWKEDIVKKQISNFLSDSEIDLDFDIEEALENITFDQNEIKELSKILNKNWYNDIYKFYELCSKWVNDYNNKQKLLSEVFWISNIPDWWNSNWIGFEYWADRFKNFSFEDTFESLLKTSWKPFLDFIYKLEKAQSYEELENILQNDLNSYIRPENRQDFESMVIYYMNTNENVDLEYSDIESLNSVLGLSIENYNIYMVEVLRQKDNIDSSIKSFVDDIDGLDETSKRELRRWIRESLDEALFDEEDENESNNVLGTFFDTLKGKIGDSDNISENEINNIIMPAFGDARDDIDKFVKLFFDLEKTKETHEIINNTTHELLQENEDLLEWNEQDLSYIIRYYIENDWFEWISSHSEKVAITNILTQTDKIDLWDNTISEIRGFIWSDEYDWLDSLKWYLDDDQIEVLWKEVENRQSNINNLIDQIQDDENLNSILQKNSEELDNTINELDERQNEVSSFIEENYEEEFYWSFVSWLNSEKYEQRKDNQDITDIETSFDEWKTSSIRSSFDSPFQLPWERVEYESSNKAKNPFYDSENPNSKEYIEWTWKIDTNKNIIMEYFSTNWFWLNNMECTPDEFKERFGVSLDKDLTNDDFDKIWKILWKHLIEKMSQLQQENSNFSWKNSVITELISWIIKNPTDWLKKYFNYAGNVNTEFNEKIWLIDHEWNFDVKQIQEWSWSNIQEYYNTKKEELTTQKTWLARIKALFSK